jgi:hypothetical protein
MKKHTYRAQKVNNINWQQVKEQTTGEALVLAVDVAKVQQYALLTNQEHTQRLAPICFDRLLKY